MKRQVSKFILCGALAVFIFNSCSDDDNVDPGKPVETERWITIAGALMQDQPGDGNGGTKVYAVSYEEAKNPEVSINVYEDGFGEIGRAHV